MSTYEDVFSEYEVDELGFIVGSESVVKVPCIGKLEEELEVKTVTKSCRGVVKKSVSRGTGAGTLTVEAHVPVKLVREIYAMGVEGLKDGVYAYGQNSRHPQFTLTAHVLNEDGIEKLKAYPVCVIQSNYTGSIENGADEVAQISLEIAVMPDNAGNGMYEAIVSDVTDETVKSTWMASFKPALVEVTA